MMRSQLSNIQPVLRKDTLNLDSRFFPSGIHPSSLIEISGVSGSGKTFLTTYFLARFLTKFPTKRALLIDTRGHFNLSNLVSMLQYIDSETKPSTKAVTEHTNEINEPYYQNGKLLSYLKRLTVVKCNDCDTFLKQLKSPGVKTIVTATDLAPHFHKRCSTSPKEPQSKKHCVAVSKIFHPNSFPTNSDQNTDNTDMDMDTNTPCNMPLPSPSTTLVNSAIPSPLEERLLIEQDISLVIIDSIDTFSHSPAFYKSEHCRNTAEFPNIVKLVRDATKSTRTPVICTLTEYIKLKPAPVIKPVQAATVSVIDRERYSTTSFQSEGAQTLDENEDDSQCSSNTNSNNPPSQNIILEPNLFTHSLTLTLLPNKNPPVSIDALLAKRGFRNSDAANDPETQNMFSQLYSTQCGQRQIMSSSVGSNSHVSIEESNGNSNRKSDGLESKVSIPQYTTNNFECLAQYRSLFMTKGSAASSSSSIGHRVKFTIASNMLFVVLK